MSWGAFMVNLKTNKHASRKQFFNDLEQLAKALRLQIESECEGFEPDAEASRQRIKRCQQDFGFFCKTYFPHYTKFGDSILHVWLDKNLPALIDAPAGCRQGIAAPRGEAKSTKVSLQFVLWCLITRRKKFILIIADALDQSASMLEAIKAELEVNPRLAMDFSQSCGQGRVWNAGKIITANEVMIQAFGSGKRMRGLRFGAFRPDLVVCDDLENDENVKSPEQRDKLDGWLKKTVLSLGPADDSMDVIIIGTILHYDSVLSRILNNPLWRGLKFQAILEWPHDMSLWDKWEELLLNREKTSEDDALKFYHKHKKVMDEGARVSWPDARPLYSLMYKRARDGHAAFDSEQQNDPLSSDDAPFAGCMTFWVNRLAEWLMFGAVDPSLGKAGNRRDPSAIVVGGFNPNTYVLDIVEALIKKRLPDMIIEDIIALQVGYKCLMWGVEAIQFQEFLYTELIKRGALRGIPIPARAVKPTADKNLRIESLQPYVANGQIRFHTSQKTLIHQFKHWPLADHDDGPDAVKMLWDIASTGFSKFEYTPVPGLGGLRGWL